MERSIAFQQIEKLNFEIGKKVTQIVFSSVSKTMCHSHICLLLYIKNEGSCIVSDISRLMGITLSAVTSLIDKLFKMGLVRRERSDSDRRVVYISLTEKGLEITKHVEENMNKAFSELYADVTDEELETLLVVYRKIANKAKEIYKE